VPVRTPAPSVTTSTITVYRDHYVGIPYPYSYSNSYCARIIPTVRSWYPWTIPYRGHPHRPIVYPRRSHHH